MSRGFLGRITAKFNSEIYRITRKNAGNWYNPHGNYLHCARHLDTRGMKKVKYPVQSNHIIIYSFTIKPVMGSNGLFFLLIISYFKNPKMCWHRV